MRLEKQGRSYRVNGLVISAKALTAMLHELYSEQSWKMIETRLNTDGWIDIDFTPIEIVKNEQKHELIKARRRIAALERHVEKLTLENIYLTA